MIDGFIMVAEPCSVCTFSADTFGLLFTSPSRYSISKLEIRFDISDFKKFKLFD
jgi:hypothetical protein